MIVVYTFQRGDLSMNLHVAKVELKDPPTVNLGAMISEFLLLVPMTLLLIYVLS